MLKSFSEATLASETMLAFEGSLFAWLPPEMLGDILARVAHAAIVNPPLAGVCSRKNAMTLTCLTDWLRQVYPHERWQAAVRVAFSRPTLPRLPSADIVLGSVFERYGDDLMGRALALCVAGETLSFLSVSADRTQLHLTIGATAINLVAPPLIFDGLKGRHCNVAVTAAHDAAIVTEKGGGAWLFKAATGWHATTVLERDYRKGRAPSKICMGNRAAVLHGFEQCIVTTFGGDRVNCVETNFPFYGASSFRFGSTAICIERPNHLHVVAAGLSATAHLVYKGDYHEATICRRVCQSYQNALICALSCGELGHIELRRNSATLYVLDARTGSESTSMVLLNDVGIHAGVVVDNTFLVVAVAGVFKQRVRHSLRILRVRDGTTLHEFEVMWATGTPNCLVATDLGFLAYSSCGSNRPPQQSLQFLQHRLWPEALAVRVAALTVPEPIVKDLEVADITACHNADVFSGVQPIRALMFHGGEARMWQAYKACTPQERLDIAQAARKAHPRPTSVSATMLAIIVHRLEQQARASNPCTSNFLDDTVFLLVRLLRLAHGCRLPMMQFNFV